MRSALSDEDWALFEPLAPKSRKRAGSEDRKIRNANDSVRRSGMPSREMPER